MVIYPVLPDAAAFLLRRSIASTMQMLCECVCVFVWISERCVWCIDVRFCSD